MGSSKKHKEKDRDRDRDRKREREKRHDRDKDKQRKRSRSPRDRDERYERRKEDGDSETERKKSRVLADDDDDLLQYAMEESRNDELSEPQSSRGAGGDVSLSIEETNKLRIKLGLKPLQMDGGSEKSKEKKTTLLEDVHAPAINIGDKEQQEKMRRKLEEIREKRKIYKKLNKVQTLGESGSDEESAASWVKKSRQVEKEKELAAKTAQMLAEMDEEFGIGELINEEFGPKAKTYSSKDLRGLKVEHNQTAFKEGVTTILTLKDQGVLDEEDEVLYNINMEDKEKADKNIEKRKKKPDYQPYDESDENEMFKMRGVLEKYDEEIEGATKKSFVLDSRGTFDSSKEGDLEKMRAKLRNEMVSLEMAKPKLAAEYYTEEEMVKFKKPKKRRKVRKRETLTTLKADDLESITTGSMTRTGDHGSRKMQSRTKSDNSENYEEASMDIAPIEPVSEENFYNATTQDDNIVLEDDEAQLELEIALQRSRRAKVKKELSGADKVAQVLATTATTKQDASDDKRGVSIVIDSTSEFCRTLGEIPTYGSSGNREEEEEVGAETEMDIDQEQHKDPQGGWEWVKAQDDKNNQDAENLEEESRVLDDEPVVGSGIAAALQLATKKGLLNAQEKRKREEKFVAELPSVGVIDEDKMRGDDKDRGRSGRDRDRDRDYDRDKDRYRVEKEGYKPNVKLDYVDEHGRQMTPKEAFRYLSHRFHGKMPAKLKTEKRSKKVQEEVAMQKMSSVDTPLNTAALLKEKQKEAQSPFLILSGGGNTFSAGTTISKKK